MDKLKSLGTPIARINATHNCSKASKHDSTEDDGVIFGMSGGSDVNFKFVG